MKTITVSFLRAAALAAALFLVPSLVSAAESSPADRAAELLRSTDRIPVQSAGPYVEVGTYRIQVAVKLGRAETVLPDGTYLYPNFRAENSTAQGTLVVRFVRGKVSELYLAGPTVVASLRSNQPPKGRRDVARAE
jgi:hypothetical protein